MRRSSGAVSASDARPPRDDATRAAEEAERREALRRESTAAAEALAELERARLESPIDRFFGALRFHHLFNALAVLGALALVLTVPALTLLPLYLAIVARVPLASLQTRYDLSFAGATSVIVLGAFAVLIATVVAIGLPVTLQLLRLDAESVGALRPYAQDLVVWARGLLVALGVDPAVIDAKLDLSADRLFEIAAGSVDDGAALLLSASGAALRPVLFAGLAFLVVFLAAYALAYSENLKADLRRFLRLGFPERSVAIAERLVVHTQALGAEVFRGYAFMVVVLGLFYFLVYLGALMLFPAARSLPPLVVVVLVALSGLIGAIPGLGAKVLLVVGAVAGLVLGVLAAAFTGSVWLGVYIFVAFVVVTGFESKFGTPSTLGRALGVNSSVILYLAIAVVAGFGIVPVLWVVFVGLPLFVAAVRVMTELYGAPEPPPLGPPPPLPGASRRT